MPLDEGDALEEARAVGRSRAYSSLGYRAPRPDDLADAGENAFVAPVGQPARPQRPVDPLSHPDYRAAKQRADALSQEERLYRQRLQDFDRTEGRDLKAFTDRETGLRYQDVFDQQQQRTDAALGVLGGNAGAAALAMQGAAGKRRQLLLEKRARLASDAERIARARMDYEGTTLLPMRQRLTGGVARDALGEAMQPEQPREYLAPEGDDWVAERTREINAERQISGMEPIRPGTVSGSREDVPWVPVGQPEDEPAENVDVEVVPEAEQPPRLTPMGLIRMKRRADEYQRTIDESGTNLDEKVKTRLRGEVQNLRSRFDTGFAEQSPAFQKRIRDITRDPTLGEKVAQAGASLASGAAQAAYDIPQFVGRQTTRVANALGADIDPDRNAFNQWINEVKETAREWGPDVPEEVRQKLLDNVAINEVPGGVGGLAANLIPGRAITALSKLGALSAGAARTATLAADLGGGAASTANRLRDEVNAANEPFRELLERQREAGELSEEGYQAGLSNIQRQAREAEAVGGALGLSLAVAAPLGNWLSRVAKVPAGRIFGERLIGALREGGEQGAAEFVEGAGKPILARLIDTMGESAGFGLQQAGQTLGENVAAREIGYDPERPIVGENVTAAGASGFLLGALARGVRESMGSRRGSNRPPPTEPTAETAPTGPETTPESPQAARPAEATQDPTNARSVAENDPYAAVSEELRGELGLNRVAESPVDATPVAESQTPPASPNSPTYRFTVQRAEGDYPGWSQVDEIQGDRSLGSMSLEQAIERGIQFPPLRDLPTGQYDLDPQTGQFRPVSRNQPEATTEAPDALQIERPTQVPLRETPGDSPTVDPRGAAREESAGSPRGGDEAPPSQEASLIDPDTLRSLRAEGWADSTIATLEGLKLHKPGQLSAGTPISVAWDAAIDTAIVGIRAGRKVVEVVREAIAKFRAAFPEATEQDVQRLERSIAALNAGREPSVSGVAPEQPAEPVRQHVETVKAQGVPIESVPRDVMSREQAQAEARRFTEQLGETAAVEKALSNSPDISAGADTVVLTNAEQRMFDEVAKMPDGPAKQQAFENAVAFTKRVAERGTDEGRRVAFYNEVNRWTPLGLLNAAVEQTSAKRDRQLGKGGVKTATEAVEAVNKANAEAINEVANAPDLAAGVKLTRKVADKLGTKLTKETPDLDKAIRGAMKEMGVKVRDIIRQHYSVTDALGKTLAQKLSEQAGLSGAEAEALSKRVQERMKVLTTDAKKAALEAMEKRANADGKKVVRRTLADKLIEQSNLGALDSERYLQTVAKQLKLSQVTPADAQRLREMAEKIQAAPEGFQRNAAITDALTELKKIEGVGKMDVATAVYYAHILSGFTTQAVNGISTALNTAADVGALAARNPNQIGNVFEGLMEGLRHGAQQARRTLATGYSDKGLVHKSGGTVTAGQGEGVQPLPTLEILSKGEPTTAAGKALKGYSTVLRYVSRGMRAADAVFYETAKGAFENVAAARLAAEADGGKLTRQQLNRKVRALLARSPVDFEQARQLAKAEGLSGFDANLRVAEILRQKRIKTLGPEKTAEGREFGLRATFNDEQPRGYLGLLAKSVAQAANDVPPLKLFVPFTNIVANVTNGALNYSPVGLTRAKFGYAQENRPQGLERDTLLMKGAAGTLGMLGGMLYALNNGDKEKRPLITGRGPKDKNARDQLRETGWQPYTIKVGDKYLSYLPSPASLPAAIIGNLADAVHYDKLSEKEVGPALATALMSIPETVTNMSFLNGLSDLMAVTRGEEGAVKRLVQSTAAVPVPNLVQQIDRAFDPTIRETPGAVGMALGRIPGARQALFEPRLTPRGQPVESSPLQRFGRGETDDEIAQVLANKQAFIPAANRPNLGPPKRKRPATDEEYRAYQQDSGREINQRLQQLLPRLRGMPAQKAQEVVDEIAREAHVRARLRLEARASTPFAR